jgi:hypothetical protein
MNTTIIVYVAFSIAIKIVLAIAAYRKGYSDGISDTEESIGVFSKKDLFK